MSGARRRPDRRHARTGADVVWMRHQSRSSRNSQAAANGRRGVAGHARSSTASSDAVQQTRRCIGSSKPAPVANATCSPRCVPAVMAVSSEGSGTSRRSGTGSARSWNTGVTRHRSGPVLRPTAHRRPERAGFNDERADRAPAHPGRSGRMADRLRTFRQLPDAAEFLSTGRSVAETQVSGTRLRDRPPAGTPTCPTWQPPAAPPDRPETANLARNHSPRP